MAKLAEVGNEYYSNVEAFVQKIEERTFNNLDTGRKYSLLTITDGETIKTVTYWGPASEFPNQGKVVNFLLRNEEGRNGKVYLNMHQKNWTVVENADTTKYLKTAPIDRQETLANMMAVIEEDVKTRPLVYQVTKYLVDKYKEEFMFWSAASSVHHSYIGGLLEHTYRVMQSVLALAPVYNLDRAYLAAGAILHDIGKIKEINTDDIGNAQYSVLGNVESHVTVGARMIDDACRNLDIDPDAEEIMVLRHLILSHHGTPEMGSPKRPCTGEAFLLHIADYNDSRQWIYEKAKNSIGEGEVSEAEYFLDGVRVYHALPAPEPAPEEEEESAGETEGTDSADEQQTAVVDTVENSTVEGSEVNTETPTETEATDEADGDGGVVLEDFDLPFI